MEREKEKEFKEIGLTNTFLGHKKSMYELFRIQRRSIKTNFYTSKQFHECDASCCKNVNFVP